MCQTRPCVLTRVAGVAVERCPGISRRHVLLKQPGHLEGGEHGMGDDRGGGHLDCERTGRAERFRLRYTQRGVVSNQPDQHFFSFLSSLGWRKRVSMKF